MPEERSDIIIATHQLKNPLTRNKWILNLLLTGESGPLSQTEKELLERVNANNERTLDMLKDVLRLDKEEEGLPKHLIEISVVDVIQKISSMLKIDLLKKNISFILNGPKDELSPVFADAEDIRCLFENIIDNALRYSNNNGEITVNLNEENGMIVVAVKNDGIGIPKDDHKNIFGKFFRARNAIEIDKDGSGLGLFISKLIVEKYRGKIWFESEENKGATFWVELPIAKKGL